MRRIPDGGPTGYARGASILTALVWCSGVACCLLLPGLIGAEELRDPFVFGPRTESAKGRQGPAPRETGASPGLSLVGILWDAANPLAIIGDETVKVGDFVEQWQVVQIEQNGIVVQRGERREFVSPGTRLPSD